MHHLKTCDSATQLEGALADDPTRFMASGVCCRCNTQPRIDPANTATLAHAEPLLTFGNRGVRVSGTRLSTDGVHP